jgi:hypothetical protein
MDEAMDSRLKYLEMPDQFKGRANDISLTCKQHLRACEQLAVRLAKERPKNPQEFERLEYYKDFVIKTSQLNEQVLGLLDYCHELLNQIANDYRTVGEAKMKDILRFQSDTIEILTNQRDQLVKDLYDERKRNIGGKNTQAA